MAKSFRIFVLILIAGIILSACSSNTETAQTTQAPAPTDQGQVEPEGYPAPTEVGSLGYPYPTEAVSPLTNTGYPAPGTFTLILADGSEQAISVDVLNALPKVTISIDGSEMEVLGLMDALNNNNVETVNQITAIGAGGASLTLTSDQVSKSYLDILENGTVRLVVQGLPQNEWVEGLASLKVQ